MVKSVHINGIPYNVEDGVAISDKATNELDTITFQIRNIKKLDLEPFQPVVVELENGEKFQHILNTWVDEPATFEGGLRNYIINSISSTKRLERVQMPNMAITQRLNKTKRTYYEYANRIMKRYVNKQFPALRLSNNLKSVLSNIDAVEEQFNTPNARDYFDNMLEQVPAIVKCNGTSIDYFDLSQKGKPIDESKLFFTTSEQTLEEYYSDILTDLQGVQSEESSVYTEVVGVRAMDSAMLTTENGNLTLSHNINTIQRIRMRCYIGIPSDFGGNYIEDEVAIFDIYNKDNPDIQFVKEKAEYDLLKVSNDPNKYGAEYKNSNLYYTRGSNTIDGLFYSEKTWLAGMSFVSTIENIVRKVTNKIIIPTTITGGGQDVRDLIFEVTYSALDDVSVKFNNNERYKSVIRDNQTDSYVDLNKFALAQQEKINRLGNYAIPITARYDRLEDIPKLMDYIGDYILAEREIVIHRDYIDFKGVLYKDYIKRNLFYGVNARKRSTQLVMGSEAVTRKEIKKLKFEFDFEDKSENKATQRYLLGKITSQMQDTGDVLRTHNISMVVGTSTFENRNFVRYAMFPDVRKAYKSVTINLKFLDNINVGMKIDDKSKLAGYTQQYVSYTDQYGELIKLQFEMFDYTYLDDLFNGWNSAYSLNDLPEVAYDFLKQNYNFLTITEDINKDGREIINETIQIDFGSVDGIYITKRFADALPFFDTYNPANMRIWVSDFETYDKYNCDYVVPTAEKKEDIKISSTDFINFYYNNVLFNRIMLYNNSVDLTNAKSWALADLDGNVYLAVNRKDGILPTIIYLNEKEVI